MKARLVDELARLTGARDPFSALGVARSAEQKAVHAAFLAVTKEFHPNRFARRGAEIQTLANEVFLAFRRAYDQAKVAEKGAHPRAAERPRHRRPPAQATSPQTTISSSSPRRSAPPPIPTDARRRPARGSRSEPSSAPRPAPVAVATPRATGTPPIGTPAAVDSARERSSRIERVFGTARERKQVAAASFDDALKLLNDGNPAEARARFRALAVEHPQNRRYRVYLHYAWGREHLAAGRPDAARAEFSRALGVDAQFADARRALDELSRKKPGRFLSKLFGK